MKKSGVIAKLKAVMEAGEPGIGLPNSVYINHDLFALEQKLVFADTWSCIGFEKDIPNKGDLFPVRFLDQPLLLSRGTSGEISVFHNVCSHRGMILVEKAMNSKGLIRCPYHSWCYDLSGTLKRMPNVGGSGKDNHPDIDPSLYGLRSVRSKASFGLIFVNLSENAKSFEDTHARIFERWAEFNKVPMIHGGPESTLRLTLEANWKLAVENFCESYHLPWVHPGLNSYSQFEDHYNISEWGKFSGQGSTKYVPDFGNIGELAFPDLPGLSKKWDTGAEYVAIYPNVLLGVHRDHFWAILIEPEGPHKCHERVEIFYFDPKCTGENYQKLRVMNAEKWNSVFLEDVGVVEGMHRARSSSGFDGGIFTPVHEVPTRCFDHWVAERLLSGKKQEISMVT